MVKRQSVEETARTTSSPDPVDGTDCYRTTPHDTPVIPRHPARRRLSCWDGISCGPPLLEEICRLLLISGKAMSASTVRPQAALRTSSCRRKWVQRIGDGHQLGAWVRTHQRGGGIQAA